jgi:hypothetical protein
MGPPPKENANTDDRVSGTQDGFVTIVSGIEMRETRGTAADGQRAAQSRAMP